jgi:predicted anti-sigma-YlaC factor YlaD
MQKIHRHTEMCKKVAKHLQEELDTQLRSRACREIKRHLESCPNCTAYLDSLKKTVLLYRRFPDPRVPARTREKLFAILKLHH